MSQQFNIVKKGYDTAEVDAYIEQLESIVKSYKEKDKSIKNAILSAQIAADNIISEAKEHADEVVANSISFLDEIKKSIQTQKEYVDHFQNDYNSLVNKYLVDVNKKDFEDLKNKIKVLENYYIKLAKEKDGIPAEQKKQEKFNNLG